MPDEVRQSLRRLGISTTKVRINLLPAPCTVELIVVGCSVGAAVEGARTGIRPVQAISPDKHVYCVVT